MVGRIYEAQRSPTKFNHAGKLPYTKKLSGIRSKEVQGEALGGLGLMIQRDKLAPSCKAVMAQHNSTSANSVILKILKAVMTVVRALN